VQRCRYGAGMDGWCGDGKGGMKKR
jgi:hypothetical protein